MEKSIKVKDTRMHSYSFPAIMTNSRTGKYPGMQKISVPVAEAKLVLVECNVKEGLLWKRNRTDTDFQMATGYAIGKSGNIYYKPILISETEKDVDKCPVLCLSELEYGWKEAYRPNGRGKGATCPSCVKILAMPEHFSPKHLQAIVDGKMKDGDKVLIECEQKEIDCPDGIEGCEVFHFNHIIKLNSSNHITLYRKEEKIYTLQEVREHTHAAYRYGFSGGMEEHGHMWSKQHGADSFSKWFDQNVK